MRIAYLSTFYPFRGGIAQFNALLYKSLEKQGHDIKAYTFSCQYPSILFPGKTQYITEQDQAIPIQSQAILNTVNPFSYEKTAREILKWKPDILIMKYWMSFFAPSLGYVANRLKKRGVKIICVIDNALPHEPRFFDKSFGKFLFNNISGSIVMSEIVKNDLLSLKTDAKYYFKQHPLYDHFGEKIQEDNAKKKLNISPQLKTLLFFGLIRDYKGLDLLIESMSLLDDSFQLIIAGESYGSFEKYEKMIAASKAKNRIKVINRYINDDEVSTLFSASDLLVLPYKSATQSGVIPIAYHFEVPVIATDVGGLKETLEVPGTGIICKPEVKSLAEGINKVYSLGKENFVSNIKIEKKKLSWDSFAETVTEFAKTLE